MAGRWWLGIVLVLSLSSVLLARPGSITTRDGRTIVGDITDAGDAQTLNITVHGVTASVDRANVTSIVYADDFVKEFNTRLAALDPKDVAGRLALARWALDNQQYDLARQAATAAQGIDPASVDARTLLDEVQDQQVLNAKAGGTPKPTGTPAATGTPAGGSPAGTGTPATPTPAPAPTGPVDARFLTADDINSIRQLELRSDETNVRIIFANDVRRRFLAGSTMKAAEFDSLTPTGQALAIIKSGDPHLTKDVRIDSDPAAMVEYRTRIQPKLLAGCAASNCHGGPKAGDFYLYTPAETTPAWYTNYYILTQAKAQVNSATAFGSGPVTMPLLDSTHPGSSLLIQFALPMTVAGTPHPKVDGFKPALGGAQDAQYQQIVHWMSFSLNSFQPDYGIKFTVPTGKTASTQPTTRPN
jgi:predicted CxxxxCH...CXXCH cytochrome family protein